LDDILGVDIDVEIMIQLWSQVNCSALSTAVPHLYAESCSFSLLWFNG